MINKIYLSGGMQDLSLKDRSFWRSDFIKLFGETNIELFNPIHYPITTKKSFYIREIKSSDLLVVNFNDPKSIGTAQEIQCAIDNDIPVIGIWENEENKKRQLLGKPLKKLHPWLVQDCDRIFDNMQNCIDYIKEYYIEGRVIK